MFLQEAPVILYDTITRLRAPLIDAGYGNQTRDWTTPTSVDFRVKWSFKRVDETVGDEPHTVTRGYLVGGPDLDLEATDRVIFQGLLYEVDGEVMRSYRRGQIHHVRAYLHRINVEE
jgi:hypothetical protein